MNTVSPRLPPANQAGGGAVSALDPIRSCIVAAHRALDDLHLVVDDMLAGNPVMTPKAQAMDALRHGGEAGVQVFAAASVAGRLHLQGLGDVRRSLELARTRLGDLQKELEAPAAVIPADLRHLELDIRGYLDAATTALDALEDDEDDWDPDAPRRETPASLPPPPNVERVDPRAPSGRCGVLPTLPEGCPLDEDLPWKEPGRVG